MIAAKHGTVRAELQDDARSGRTPADRRVRGGAIPKHGAAGGAPSTVTDAKGHFAEGLTANDLIVYDNNVAQAIQVDAVVDPISLVVLVQVGSRSAPVLDKLGGSGILFSDLLSGEAGETAIVCFSDRVRVVESFTAEPKLLTRALRSLRPQGEGGVVLDGVDQSLRLLGARKAARRRVILVIGERRDRSSEVRLSALLREIQLQNAAIYWLTYSTFLAPFSARPKRVWDRMTDEEKARPERMQGKHKYPYPEEEAPLPPEMAPGSLITLFAEMKHRASVDVAALLSRTSGGRTFGFLKQRGLENAILAVGEEVHRQYIVTFQPKPDTPGVYHALRAEVRGRPELQVRTRAGYWSVQ